MVVVLLAGMGSTALAAPAQAAYDDGFCPGMTAPQNNRVVNQSPVLTNDTARVVADEVVSIRPLANDSDPDGDRLYLVSSSTPARGETCVSRTGVIEYWAEPSSASYTQRITYGVTDGDRYRTAAITVSVEGVAPVKAQLKQRLGTRKGGNKAKKRAIVAFTNPNRLSVYLFAGNPKKNRPSFRRTLAPGQTQYFRTKLRRVAFIAARPTSAGELSLVSIGLLNTRNGRQRTIAPEDFARTAPAARTMADNWIR